MTTAPSVRLRRHPLVRVMRLLLGTVMLPFLGVAALLPRRHTRRLVWGPVPLINNKYWSEAMRQAGWESHTLMRGFYSAINQREDFDAYIDGLVPRWLGPRLFRSELGSYVAMWRILRGAAVVHIPFTGGPLGITPMWRAEHRLLRWAGVRSVVIPYGADVYRYSRVIDPSLRHALLLSYPDAARQEADVERRVRHWEARADVVLPGFQIDGAGRWDVLLPSVLVVDTDRWHPAGAPRTGDGRSGRVVILHVPNHRGFKGTEFIVQAVEDLRHDGLDVELRLLERVPNSRVRAEHAQADIVIDQIVCTAYALTGIEAMASGLPVVANLDSEVSTRLFRRWSYLDECPIVSATPESVRHVLEALVRDPHLRAELGRAGREYAVKYHSYAFAQHLFGAVYARILDGQPVDLLNLYNPRTSQYVNGRPLVSHPLHENRLPGHPGGRSRVGTHP
jgi:glycosyltransferase involved in cell wall biosynthesis